MSEQIVRNGGITFLELLTIVFVACKLTKVISWSWWWVLGPIWIPFVLVVGVLLLCAIIGAIFGK